MSQAAREQLAQAAHALVRLRLSQGSSGNLSIRMGEDMLITPSGIPGEQLRAEDMVQLALDDGAFRHHLKPSSEWQLHRDIYRTRPELGAVVHAHPVHATTLAIRRMAIPPLHYMIVVGGGRDIPCAPYATYGTPELSDNVLRTLAGRTACLMANHGMIAAAGNLERALWAAVEIENLAHQYILSLQIGGPTLLSDAEVDAVLEKFRTYGPAALSGASAG